MDPIVSAVVAALAVLGNTSLDQTLREATADAYDKLKSLLKRKFGDKHAAATLIDEIEAHHASEAIVAEKGPMIAALKLGSDPDILEAVRSLETATSVISKTSIQNRVINCYGKIVGNVGDRCTTNIFGAAPDTKTK